MTTSLRDRIISDSPGDLVADFYLNGTPKIFDEDERAYRHWRRLAADLIGVDENEIQIVGSAAVGLSMNPHKEFKTFDAASDIDIAVISQHFFENAWRYIRRLDLGDPKVTGPQKETVKSHKKHHVFYGCVATDKILPLLPFKKQWMEASIRLARERPTVDREIKFRIYKDIAAFVDYHRRNIETLQRAAED